MSGFDLNELAKGNPAIARAQAIVDAVNQAAKVMRGWRTKHGLSQVAMAEKLGVEQPRIAQIESGKPGNSPSLKQVAEYAFHLGEKLAVCDRAQIEDRSVSTELEKTIANLEAKIQWLNAELAKAKGTPPRKKGYIEMFTGRARAPKYAPIPVPVMGYPAAVSAKSGQHGITIIHVDDDGTIHLDDAQGYQVGDVIDAKSGVQLCDGYALADQWGTQYVSKGKLKDLSAAIDEYATKKPTAYDVFKAVSDVIGPIEPGTTAVFKDKA